MTVRVTHTPCGQAVDLTDDNRVVVPGTDVPHTCPVTARTDTDLFSSQEVAT